ncbi:MAG: hypothetical protein JXR96_16175 [Deltaproteobacteria bacterium]|nr:hypothetical protein [Deltaproteobacteria bacterium]
MDRVTSIAAALLAVLVLACGNGNGESEPCEPETGAAVRALFALDPAELGPFPSPVLTQAAADSPTGLRLALPPEGPPVLAAGLAVLDRAVLLEGLNGRDGFSPTSPVLLPLDGPVDPASLPATPEDAALESASVFLVDADPASASFGERVPAKVRALEFSSPDGDLEHRIAVAPAAPLRSASRYAAVITREVRDLDGVPIGPCAAWSYASGRCETPADHPRREQLEALAAEHGALFDELGLDREALAAAALFTTQTIESGLEAVHDLNLPAPEVDFDLDGDELPDVFAPAELPDAPEDALRLEHVGVVVRGAFETAELRDTDGRIHYDSSGAPIVEAMVRQPFVLSLPADPAAQPCPLVIVQHGHGARKEFSLYLAGYLAEQGIATLAIDLVEHGEYPRRGDAFIDLSDFAATGDSFIQSAANLMRLIELAETELTAVDLGPDGAGDGQPDLDTRRFGYAGESAGAMTGALLCGREEAVSAAVLNVGGGGLANFLLFYLADIYEERELLPLAVAVQTIMDKADPLGHAFALRDRAVLMQEAAGDGIMPNLATEDLARAIGLPLLRPVHHQVEGLDVVDSPARGRGLFQFDPAEHGFLMANAEHPESSHAARAQIAHYFKTLFEDGQAEIIAP